jgi:uncharacterized protein (TIGR02996 family)
MSDGEALRAAIRANPTDTTVRLVFADWLDENAEPGGDLIRLLVNSSLEDAVPRVVGWFRRHHGWPVTERLNGEWLWAVLRAEWWTDQEQLQECVRTIARRMLPVAESVQQQLSIVQRILRLDSTAIYADAIIQAANSQGIDEVPRGGWVAAAAANLARVHQPGPIMPLHEEFCEQVHVVAWVWLGLPPLHQAPSVEMHDATSEPLPATEQPRRPWWRRLLGG